MNKIQHLLLLSAMMLSVLGFGQTGTGVVFETDASYAFAATTVDSTSSFTFEVINDVGAEQTIYFSALDAPFSLVDNSPLVIAANDTASVTLQFQPTELGSFSGSLEAAGSVFGSATLNFSGEGIQVVLDWTPESLAFDTTAIGGSSHLDVIISNVGDGQAQVTVDDSPSGLFTAAFVEGTVEVLESCEYLSVEYYTFTLHVDLGSDPGNTYWYIYDEEPAFVYGGSYNNPSDGLEMCLPVAQNDGSSGQTYIQFFNYGSGQDATLEIRDGFGNTVQFITLSPSDQDFEEWVELELGEAPISYTTLGNSVSIAEGQTVTLRTVFQPSDAGEVSDVLSLQTNSPVTPDIELACSGVGISELGGDVCDLVMTAANSLYIFSDDVVIPVGCDLTIEAGVEVLLGDYTLLVEGGIEILGSGANPVTFIGGNVILEEGEAVYISNLIVEANDLNTPYELAYLNDFSLPSHEHEFDCECPDTGYLGTGNADYNYSDGCYRFLREASSGISYQRNSDDYYLDFESKDYDGYIYPDEFPIASVGGKYAISFFMRTSHMEQNCRVLLEVFNGESWIPIYESRPDISNSDPRHLVYGEYEFLAGEEVKFRIHNDIGSTSSNSDEMRVYVDEVRVERVRNEINVDVWHFDQHAEWQDLVDNYPGQITIEGDTAYFRMDNGVDLYTDQWSNPPLLAEASGWYILELESRVLEHDYYSSNTVYWKTSNSSSWNVLQGNDYRYSSTGGYLWDWRKDRCYVPVWLDAGTRIDFRIYVNPYSDSYAMDVDFANFRLYRYGDDVGDFRVYLESARSAHISGSFLAACRFTDSDLDTQVSEISDVRLNNSSMTDLASTFQSIKGSGTCEIDLNESVVESSDAHGIFMEGDSAILSAQFSRISGNHGHGIAISAEEGQLNLSNCIVADNLGYGVQTSVPGQIDYVTIANNGLTGWNRGLSSSEVAYDQYGNCVTDQDNDGICDEIDPLVAQWSETFQTWQCINDENGNGICDENEGGLSPASSIINNCIIANNAFNTGEDINEPNALIQYTYTDQYPHFVEGSSMLEPYSPCVDAAMPWHNDQNMPYGIGGLRADMGAYGGPDNAGWGGDPAPSGSAALQSVADTPQDQGYNVGLTFDASAFDNSIVSDNISHYAIWRHFDPTGEPIESLSEGNWELLGTMPAQGFSGYAYQAEALGNSNTFGDFSSCYTVVAHTDDEDVYWYSNVSCGESVDNLAPDDPDLNGLVLETGEAQISWSVPTEEDYDYTEIFNDNGFSAEVGTDTLVVDAAVQEGNSYTYTAINYDVNGNASDPSTITLDIPAGLDIIPLTAGWNLISTDRTPTDASIEAVFATLEPGNLDYITGFDGGVQFYDPEGLSFLNSLSALTNGQGYWVRVAEDDTLEVSGASLQANYLPALNAGWNIIGFPNAADAAPADYFADFITDGSLEYVTGFDDGSTYFDPNGLSFLNSLTALENGLGYWVKVTEPFDPNGMVLTGDEPTAALTGASQQHANPNFMLINGTSDLTQAAGTQVEVRRTDGNLVAQLPVLEGGYLMTTALFGDDPSTDATEGLQVGEELHFEVQGQRAEQSLVYSGQMDIKHLELTFGAAQAMASIFPNPFVASLQVIAVVETPGYLMCELTDAVGKVVAQQPMGWQAKGTFNGTWEVLGLAPGMYTCKILKDDEVLLTTPVLKR